VDSRSSKIRDRWYRDAAWSAAGLDDQGKHSSYFGVLKNRSAPPLVCRLLDWCGRPQQIVASEGLGDHGAADARPVVG